jgi:hypothetical protein
VSAPAVLDRHGRLACPICGETNLHHEALEWWWREREDAPSQCEILGAVLEGQVADRSHNPSGRRNGLRIRFYCEFGCHVPPLDFAQHKGVTFVEWGEQ